MTPFKADDLKKLLTQYGKDKSLYGLYLWGHGVDDVKTGLKGFMTNGRDFGHLATAEKNFFGWIPKQKLPPQAFDYFVEWQDVNIPYKLGAAFIFTCFGKNGFTLASPTSVKWGTADVLVPLGVGGEVAKVLARDYDPTAK